MCTDINNLCLLTLTSLVVHEISIIMSLLREETCILDVCLFDTKGYLNAASHGCKQLIHDKLLNIIKQ